MFEFIKKMFVISLTSTVSASNHMKCVSSSNQTCMTLLLLLIYILMSIVKSYVTIRLRLIR